MGGAVMGRHNGLQVAGQASYAVKSDPSSESWQRLLVLYFPTQTQSYSSTPLIRKFSSSTQVDGAEELKALGSKDGILDIEGLLEGIIDGVCDGNKLGDDEGVFEGIIDGV